MSRHAAAYSPADDRLSGKLWPSDDQRALLGLILREGEPAPGEWLGRVIASVEDDPRIRYLLPMAYHRLEATHPGHPSITTLRTARLGFASQVSRQNVLWRRVIGELVEAGTTPVLLKGLSLASDYYPQPALRPGTDADIYVDVAHRRRAHEILTASGWEVEDEAKRDPVFEHAAPYAHPRYRYADIDLHVHMLSKCHAQAIDVWFAARTEAFDFGGVRVDRLDPTALLAHTALHGLRWSKMTPIRWIVDAAQVLGKRGGDIRWEELLDFAAEHRFLQRLALALGFLEGEYAAGVPTPVLSRLHAHRPGRLERFENALLLRPFPYDEGPTGRSRYLLHQIVWRALRMRGGAWLPIDVVRVVRHMSGDDELVRTAQRALHFGRRAR